MESDLFRWYARLRRGRQDDANGRQPVLAHYCQLLRLVSGLPNSAVLAFADGLQASQDDDVRFDRLRRCWQVQEFLSFLRTLEERDQRTVWAMLSQELFPGVPPDQSVFAGVRDASGVRDATRRLRYATVSGEEVLRTVVGLPPALTPAEVPMAWNANPEDVVLATLGLQWNELAEWKVQQDELAKRHSGGTMTSSGSVAGSKRKSSASRSRSKHAKGLRGGISDEAIEAARARNQAEQARLKEQWTKKSQQEGQRVAYTRAMECRKGQ